MVDHDRTAARDKMKCLIYKCQCKSFVPDRKYYRQRLAFAISGRISLIASDAVTTLNESSRSSILSSFFINIGIPKVRMNHLSKLPSSHIIITHDNNNREGKRFWETIFVSATHCG